ncbi:MAG: N-acetylmuramoyl-L-alanine amidase [Clostridia bacterium]|nr:N-acetylmuramoyl-L-alanine amidase [Clostridia bacterium]
MKKYTAEEYVKYIDAFNFKRKITKIQLHHTYSPNIKSFSVNNHMALQQGMKNYHVKSRGFSDIAQNLTIFPDGTVVSGRDLNIKPAGITNANTGAICIECLGNFDAETMPTEQKNTIVSVMKALLKKCKLVPESAVVYHAWYSSAGFIGDYNKKTSLKTCPGVNFFGGNTRKAFEKNLLPLLREEPQKTIETPNDILWDLMNNPKIKIEITDEKRALEALTKAKMEQNSLYWIIYKIVNKARA